MGGRGQWETVLCTRSIGLKDMLEVLQFVYLVVVSQSWWTLSHIHCNTPVMVLWGWSGSGCSSWCGWIFVDRCGQPVQASGHLYVQKKQCSLTSFSCSVVSDVWVLSVNVLPPIHDITLLSFYIYFSFVTDKDLCDWSVLQSLSALFNNCIVLQHVSLKNWLRLPKETFVSI